MNAYKQVLSARYIIFGFNNHQCMVTAVSGFIEQGSSMTKEILNTTIIHQILQELADTFVC